MSTNEQTNERKKERANERRKEVYMYSHDEASDCNRWKYYSLYMGHVQHS